MKEEEVYQQLLSMTAKQNLHGQAGEDAEIPLM